MEELDKDEIVARADFVFEIGKELMKKHAYTHALFRIERKLDEILALLKADDGSVER